MFSNRIPSDLAPNSLTTALRAMRREGRPFIDLTESNPTRAGFDYPANLLAPLADPRGRVYDPAPFGALAARQAVARDYARQGVRVEPDQVVLTASTSDAYALLFKLLADAGDEVLVPRPSYPLFEHLTRFDLVATVPYDLAYDACWSIDLDSVARALGPRTRAVLIVSPNNPTGSLVSTGELDRLAALCAQRGIAIIADEVFVDYDLTPGAAARAGRPATRQDALSFSLGGLSKTVGLPQVKLGWILVSGPDRLVSAALARLELLCDTYLSVSTPAQLAAADLLEGGSRVRAQIGERVRANYRQLETASALVPSCRVLGADAGWYGVLRVPTLDSEEQLVLDLLTRRGVLVHPGFFFDFPRESFLIVSLLPEAAAFREGVDRVLRHFDCTDV